MAQASGRTSGWHPLRLHDLAPSPVGVRSSPGSPISAHDQGLVTRTRAGRSLHSCGQALAVAAETSGVH